MSLLLHNKSSEPISTVTFNIVGTSNIKLPGVDEDKGIRIETGIAPQATLEHRIVLDVKDTSSPQKLKGILVYRVRVALLLGTSSIPLT